MKTYRFIGISALMTFVVFAFTAKAEKPFYVYQKDGKINAFFTSQVDSIVLSKIDTDSLIQSNFVTQEYYSVDSVYRIPIASIDSVSFVTPSTIYKDGVRELSGEIRKYIANTEGLKLYLSNALPSELYPKIGDKLVSTIGDEYLQSAFMGRVCEIRQEGDKVLVNCEPVGSSEIFERYYGISTSFEDSQSRGIINGIYGTNGPVRIHLDPVTFNFTSGTLDNPIGYERNNNLAFNLDEEVLNITLDEIYDVSAFTIINPLYDYYLSINIIGNYTLDQAFRVSGDIDCYFDKTSIKKSWPIPEALIDVYLKGGIFLDANLSFSLDFNAQQKYRSVFHWERSLKGKESIKNTNVFFPTESTYTGTFALNGEFSVGFFTELGVEFILDADLDISQIDIIGKAGWKIGGQYLATKADIETTKYTTKLYNILKNKRLYIDSFTSADIEAKFFNWSFDLNIPFKPFNMHKNILSYNALPKFKDTKWFNNSYPYEAATTVFGNCPKTNVGLCLLSKDHTQQLINYLGVYDMKKANMAITGTFPDADPNAEKDTYDLYTVVEYMGNDLLADSGEELAKAVLPIITSSQSSCVTLVSGAPIVGNTVDDKSKTILIVGNMLPVQPME